MANALGGSTSGVSSILSSPNAGIGTGGGPNPDPTIIGPSNPPTPTVGVSGLPGFNTNTNTNVSGNSSPGAGATTGGTNSTTTAAQLAAQSNYNNVLAGDTNAINTAIGANAGQYGSGILTAFNGTNGFGDRQSTINQDQVQNDLSYDQGMKGVRDMVNNGVQGAGVVLDNDGSGTSSAADAVARAYGTQGRQQASSVGSQYAQGQSAVGTQQSQLNNDENDFVTNVTPQTKQNTINTIVSNANQMLSYLSAIGSSGNITNQVDIAQRIAQVKAQATDALSAYDGQLQSSMAKNAPTSAADNTSKAANLFAAGTAPAQEFNYTNQEPAQLQNTGPAASNLPIYISSTQNKNNNGITG